MRNVHSKYTTKTRHFNSTVFWFDVGQINRLKMHLNPLKLNKNVNVGPKICPRKKKISVPESTLFSNLSFLLPKSVLWVTYCVQAALNTTQSRSI